MKSGKRWRKIMIVLNFLFVIPCLLVCLAPFINPGTFWFIAIFGFIFPYLLIFTFIFLTIWLVKKSKWAFLSAAALLLSFQQIGVLFGWHPGYEFASEKPAGTLRVLSWNINKWDQANVKMRKETGFRNLMMDLIQGQDADVLCFQEFFESYDIPLTEANTPALEKMGYPYHYFFPTSKIYEGAFQFGLAIFSRIPITDSAHFISGEHPHSEGLSYIDIKPGGYPIRIFTTHLESVGFDKQDYDGFGNVQGARGILAKMKNSYELRAQQAITLRTYIDASPYPVIVCGDLDDVPNSYAYFKVKGQLQDVFLKKGFWMGRTFGSISPTLRIDYIFADKKFKVRQYARLQVPYSDHYPVLADLQYAATN